MAEKNKHPRYIKHFSAKVNQSSTPWKAGIFLTYNPFQKKSLNLGYIKTKTFTITLNERTSNYEKIYPQNKLNKKLLLKF